MTERAALEQALRATPFAEELQALAGESAQAAVLLEQLATAFFPGGGDLKHFAWPDRRSRPPNGSARAASDPQTLAEARLQAAEARFRTLVEQIPAVTFM